MKLLQIALLIIIILPIQQTNAQNCLMSNRSIEPGFQRAFFNPGNHLTRKQLNLQLSSMSYFEFIRLPEYSTFLHPKGNRLMAINSNFLLKPDCNNANVLINDYYWLKLNYNHELSCEYTLVLEHNLLHFNPNFLPQTLVPKLYPKLNPNLTLPLYFYISPKSIVESVKYCHAVVRTIVVDWDCVKMAGIMGTEHCPTTITFELTDPKDIEKYGRYQVLQTTEAQSCSVKTIESIFLMKYKNGSVFVSLERKNHSFF